MRFIVHELADIFTSNGIIPALTLASAPTDELFNLRIAGFKYMSETKSSVLSITLLDAFTGYKLSLFGEGNQKVEVICYPSQEIMNATGNFVPVNELKEGDTLFSISGAFIVDKVELLDIGNYNFYSILTNEEYNNIYVSLMAFKSMSVEG